MNTEKTFEVAGVKIILKRGNVLDTNCDVVVNTANMWLRNGAGVTGALFTSLDYKFEEDSRNIGYCPLGHVVLVEATPYVPTPNDKSRSNPFVPGFSQVAHLSAPEYQTDRVPECKLLTSQAIMQALEICDNDGYSTICFPSIGTGAYRVPVDKAAQWHIDSILAMIDELVTLKTIEIRLFDLPTLAQYRCIFEDTIAEYSEGMN